MDLTLCPECAAPAEIQWSAVLESTDGPVEHAKILCVRRHWFQLPATTLPPAKVVTTTDERLDLEFAYTSYHDSCRDLYSPSYCCRRPLGHDEAHAAGFGQHRVRWQQYPEHGLDAPPIS